MRSFIAQIRSLALLLIGISSGKTETIEIQHFAPHALIPGEETILTFSGSKLENTTELWTSFNGTARRVPGTNSALISFSVQCPAELAPGLSFLQLAAPNGISGFQFILIDPLPRQTHNDNHQQKQTAQRLQPPAAIDCILKKEAVDYYAVSGRAGQKIPIEIVAHRLGSQMDSVVRILDSNGRELAYCDDGHPSTRDSQLEFTCPSDGEYFIAVHDIGYQGGPAYDYRLRVGASFLDPFPFRSGRSSNALTNFEETEPNNSTDAALQFKFPARLNATITGDDVDYLEFDVEENQKLIFQSQTRGIGSPCDLVLQLLKPDGSLLVESDPAIPSDAALTNTFSEAGTYLLRIHELTRRLREPQPYRITLERFTPGFQLTTETSKLEIARGETAIVKIECARFSYDGPISLELANIGEGLYLENNIIPEKNKEHEVKIRASEEWQPATLVHVQMIGRGHTKNREITSALSTGPALRKDFSLILHPPEALDGVLAIGIKAK